MRIGLIGGTFNPIHKGHLKVAGEIFDRFKLDSVIFIPSSQPPHKKKKKPAASGAMTIIVNGSRKNIIAKVMKGEEVGTIFLPESKLKSRKYWIAFTLNPKGAVKVDNGAKKALIDRGKSLLPSGIIETKGNFKPGDSISCIDLKGKEFARGLVNFHSKDLTKIEGCHTKEIEKILGYKYYDEVIHRDNLVIL